MCVYVRVFARNFFFFEVCSVCDHSHVNVRFKCTFQVYVCVFACVFRPGGVILTERSVYVRGLDA
jgi:hypothetical protein